MPDVVHISFAGADQITKALQPVVDEQIDLVNKHAGNVALRTYHLSPHATPEQVERDLTRQVQTFSPGRGKPYTIPFAQTIIQRAGETPRRAAAAVPRFIARRKARAGQTRSGWAHAAGAVDQRPVPAEAAKHENRGRGVPARSGDEPAVAQIENLAQLRGPKADQADRKRERALKRAIAEEQPNWEAEAKRALAKSAAKFNRP